MRYDYFFNIYTPREDDEYSYYLTRIFGSIYGDEFQVFRAPMHVVDGENSYPLVRGYKHLKQP